MTIDELEERLAKYSEDQAVKQDKSDKADICKSETFIYIISFCQICAAHR